MSVGGTYFPGKQIWLILKRADRIGQDDMCRKIMLQTTTPVKTSKRTASSYIYLLNIPWRIIFIFLIFYFAGEEMMTRITRMSSEKANWARMDSGLKGREKWKDRWRAALHFPHTIQYHLIEQLVLHNKLLDRLHWILVAYYAITAITSLCSSTNHQSAIGEDFSASRLVYLSFFFV